MGSGERSALWFSLARAGSEPGDDTAVPAANDSVVGGAAASGAPLDFRVELEDAAGHTATLPLSTFRSIPPELPARFTKLRWLDRLQYHSPTEPVLQAFELPLARFVELEPSLEPGRLVSVRFIFDRSPSGSIVVDEIGFGSARWATAAPASSP